MIPKALGIGFTKGRVSGCVGLSRRIVAMARLCMCDSFSICCVIHFLAVVCESILNNANVVDTGGYCGTVILLGLVRAHSSH